MAEISTPIERVKPHLGRGRLRQDLSQTSGGVELAVTHPSDKNQKEPRAAREGAPPRKNYHFRQAKKTGKAFLLKKSAKRRCSGSGNGSEAGPILGCRGFGRREKKWRILDSKKSVRGGIVSLRVTKGGKLIETGF